MRSKLLQGSAFALVALVVALVVGRALYPTDRTPKGAYYRVVAAVNERDPEALFPYLETAAQHAAFSIHRYNADAVKRIREDYPESERERALAERVHLAEAGQGPGVFALYTKRLGWLDRLRRDLSGVARVEIDGERATVETVRGTRYAFRKRENGMWGLTLFTGKLVADAEKAARDYGVIDAAAKDFATARAQ